MIRGRVNAELQPYVSIELRTHSGEFEEFDLKLDTGFNGELGLPSSTLERLQTNPRGCFVTRFANGESETVHAYDVEAVIDGEVTPLTAMEFRSGSHLLGMKALPMWTACVEFRVNGDVTIQKPQWK